MSLLPTACSIHGNIRHRAIATVVVNLPEKIRAYERRRPVSASPIPTMQATAPPMINHIDLSVGFPVNALETSDPKECDALKPKINSTMPSARMAMPTILFMVFLSFPLILASTTIWANREFPYSIVSWVGTPCYGVPARVLAGGINQPGT